MMDESSQVYLEFRNAFIEDPHPDYSKEEREIIKEAEKTKENFDRLGTRADVIGGRATVLLNSVSITNLSPHCLYILKFMLKLAEIQLYNAISVGETKTIKLLTESALEESRKSTKLGQNVMLLTYVCIFYLTLAFCTVS
jgi:hypothetical protein